PMGRGRGGVVLRIPFSRFLYGFQGQPQYKTASAAFTSLIEHIAPMRPRDLAGQGETKTGALNAAAERIVRAIKLLKDLLATAIGNAEATVENLDVHIGQRVGVTLDAQSDLLPAVRILLGVGK